jgi:exodeoxyribonuclease V alpha subunit
VERVTFFSEETGFCVLRVKTDGHRDLVTLVGSLPSVSAGEWLTAQGDWVIDKDHGRQLEVFHFKTMPPNTREGMEKYLASGMVKGIGWESPLIQPIGLALLPSMSYWRRHRPVTVLQI